MSRARVPAGLLVAGAFVAGTLAGAILGGGWWWTAVVASLIAAAAALVRVDAGWWCLLAAAALLATAGHARYVDAAAHPLPRIATLEGLHEVTGVARDDATLSGTFARVDLDVETIDGEPADGGVRVTMPAPREPTRAGDRLRVTGEVEPPPVVEDFDYGGYLLSRGIHATVAFPEHWERIGRADRGPAGRLDDLGRWATANIERALPEPASALAAGVLTGERRSMSPAVTEELRVTGTTHLVVVSGQNVALLLGSAIAVMTAAVSRRRAAVLSLLLLPPYVLLVGAEPPVVRAAIMAVGIALASVTGRRTPAWVYLLYAVAFMLALDPSLALDVAFQLSATATAGVMLIAPPVRDTALRLLRWEPEGPRAAFIEVAATATGAALAVVPVQAAAFERVSLITIPANVAVAPLYEATVLVALAAALLGWFEPAAAVLGAAGRLVPEAFLGLVSVLADLPGAEVPVDAPLMAGVAWFAATGVATWWLSRRGAAHRAAAPALALSHRPLPGRTVALAVVGGGLWLAVLTPGQDLASVTVLDVGQGAAVLVRDGGATVLVDVGPPDGAALRALPEAGVRGGIDAVVLTHADADHAGGLDAVLRRMEVGAVLGEAQTLAALGIEGRAIDIGDRLRLGPRTSIEVLSPPVATRGRAHSSENDASLVLLVTIGERRVLLGADIGAAAEEWLVRSGQSLRAEVLLVPHQGSKTSSMPAFVEAVSPTVAVVSVGADNPFGHPAPEVLERYAEAGARLYRTDEDGSIIVRSDGERLWVATGR